MTENVTAKELSDALLATSPSTPYGERAQQMLGHIAKQRQWRENASKPPEPEPVFTQAELAAALKRIGYSSTAHAGNIVRDILNHREPVWQTGDIVRSGSGEVFIRHADGDWSKASDEPGFTRFPKLVAPVSLIGRAV
jgi:hypothetical protein